MKTLSIQMRNPASPRGNKYITYSSEISLNNDGYLNNKGDSRDIIVGNEDDNPY